MSNLKLIKGKKIRFTGATTPFGSVNRNPEKFLTVGKEYTLLKSDEKSCYTIVYIEEVPGKPFNSVQFEDVE